MFLLTHTCTTGIPAFIWKRLAAKRAAAAKASFTFFGAVVVVPKYSAVWMGMFTLMPMASHRYKSGSIDGRKTAKCRFTVVFMLMCFQQIDVFFMTAVFPLMFLPTNWWFFSKDSGVPAHDFSTSWCVFLFFCLTFDKTKLLRFYLGSTYKSTDKFNKYGQDK